MGPLPAPAQRIMSRLTAQKLHRPPLPNYTTPHLSPYIESHTVQNPLGRCTRDVFALHTRLNRRMLGVTVSFPGKVIVAISQQDG